MSTARRMPYPSVLTDEQWERLQPLPPPPKKTGRPRELDLREVVNAILYFPPKSSLHGYFAA